MPGAMRKMGVYLGLVEDGDGDGYAGDADSYDREPADTRTAARPARTRPEYPRSAGSTAVAPREWGGEPAGYEGHRPDAHRADAARPDAGSADLDGEVYGAEYADYEQPSYRITTLHPRTYNEAVTIGEHFRSGTPVIMNLSEMADSDAKRLVDFAAGLTFGLHGRVERVTAKVFLLSPQNVTVTAQDKARIAENGFFNQS